MLLNDMNEFTLLTALNAVKKHFLVTIVLFGLTYWLLPSMNFIDNRYSMEKTIIRGEGAKGYLADFLNFSDIHAILSSANTGTFMSENLDGSVANFQVIKTEENNIVLVLKHHDTDKIFKTAILIMERLQEFDELAIQKQTSLIDKDIAALNKKREAFFLYDEQYVVTNNDIEEYVTMQKNFDAAFTIPDVDRKNNSDINGLTRLKRENTFRRFNDNLGVLEIENNIKKLEEIFENGFKKVSYLFPVSLNDISRYYPNNIIFFGISLLTAFFYNLIMLNFLYIKYKKNV